jgi:hypothetical protein
VRYPAPNSGIDSRIALTESSPKNCIYTYNLVPYEYGMSVRKGYREWQKNASEGESVGIHTIIPFDGVLENGDDDRLFAVTNEGIWDVSEIGSTPVLKFTFVDQQIDAGYGVYSHFVGNDGNDRLFYADNRNGLFEYDVTGDLWQQAQGITGPVVENIRFIVSHKQRIWLIEEDSTKAWYLPVGSIAGEAQEFFFGGKFRHGGNLEGLFNWSVDGGDGLDDYLVAVSRAGDVLPYQGADPSTADTWNLVGTYYIGQVPKGPHFGSEHGGELFLLSKYGITSLNDLLQGVDTTTLQAGIDASSLSGKITSLLRDRLDLSISKNGWKISTIPSEGGLLISSPKIGSGDNIQFYYNFSTRAWGLWRGLPIESFDNYAGNVVFGDPENRVCVMDVNVDDARLDAVEGRPNCDDIEFSVLSFYNPLDSAGSYKRVKMIRPDFISGGDVSYAVQARYDYDLAEALRPSANPSDLDGKWDLSNWDTAIWGAGGLSPVNDVIGSWGIGRYIAVAMNGKTREETRFIGWDVIFDVGGYMI